MARANFVKKARKDNTVAKKGESYWWWKFAYGSKQYSKVRPDRSQLTKSSFKSQLYSIQDEGYSAESHSDVDSHITSVTEQLETLRDECQESFDNIPEQLQEAPAGETLTMRIDSLDEAISEIENIDLDEIETNETEITDKQNEINSLPDDAEASENEDIQDQRDTFDTELEELETDLETKCTDAMTELEEALGNIEEG